MNVVVTGSSGFLGSWICRVLAEDFRVTALVRPTSDLFRLTGVNDLNIVPVETNEWPEYISRSKPDVLILVDWWGVGNQDRNDSRQYQNINRMCDLAKSAKEAGVATVIGVGSQAELGPVENDISEDLPDQPTTKYGFAKAEARLKLRNIFKGSKTRFVWMRVFSTYGPLDTGNWLIPQTVDSIIQGKCMKLTKGEQEWSYLHAYDLALGFKKAIETESISGTVNIGNPETIILRDAVTSIARKLDAQNLLDFGAIEYREDQVMKLKPLCEKLSNAGWKPEVEFESGITQTMNWLEGKTSNSLYLSSGNEVTFNLPLRP